VRLYADVPHGLAATRAFRRERFVIKVLSGHLPSLSDSFDFACCCCTSCCRIAGCSRGRRAGLFAFAGC